MKKGKVVLQGIIFGIIVAAVLFIIEHYLLSGFSIVIQGLAAGLIVMVIALLFSFVVRKLK